MDSGERRGGAVGVQLQACSCRPAGPTPRPRRAATVLVQVGYGFRTDTRPISCLHAGYEEL